MGDISTEPSMEEILSSIKRIISEEGSTATPPRSRRSARPLPQQSESRGGGRDVEDEVLELSNPVDSPRPDPVAERREPESAKDVPCQQEQVEALRNAETIISDRAAQASRGQLEALSRMVIKPQTPGSDTLEGMVREMLRPMLSDWLDENLPRIVEQMVAKEISRITGRNG